MRSVSWAALLVPLLFSALPAAARERLVERVSRKRTVHVSATPGEARAELLVAGGTATVINADAPLGPGGPEWKLKVSARDWNRLQLRAAL